MPYNLLLLPLLGGYIFVRRFNRTRYGALRSENYRLLFLASEFGLYLLIVAALLRFAFNLLTPSLPFLSQVDKTWHLIFPFDYSGVAFVAFFLGLILGPIGNLFYSQDEAVDNAVEKKGDPLEVLLKKAMTETKPILLTLKNGKVYVGQVVVNFNPAYEVQSLKIMPIFSGYRKADDQTVIFNTDYTNLYQRIRENDPEVSELDKEDIGTVVTLDEIRSVSIFNLPLYSRFFSKFLQKNST
jgi:hypothetical protein